MSLDLTLIFILVYNFTLRPANWSLFSSLELRVYVTGSGMLTLAPAAPLLLLESCVLSGNS